MSHGTRWTDKKTLEFIRKLRNKEYPPELQRRFKNVDWNGLNELESDLLRKKAERKTRMIAK